MVASVGRVKAEGVQGEGNPEREGEAGKKAWATGSQLSIILFPISPMTSAV